VVRVVASHIAGHCRPEHRQLAPEDNELVRHGPHVHAASLKNPAMRGGPFLNVAPERVKWDEEGHELNKGVLML
jgi:hypothetical protein